MDHATAKLRISELIDQMQVQDLELRICTEGNTIISVKVQPNYQTSLTE